MSVFGRLFSKKKTQVVDSKASVQQILDLETQLARKQEHLERKIQHELQEAKRHGTKNKRDALRALRRKKGHEAELEKIDGTLNTLHSQRSALENASMNTEVLQIMSDASKSMKYAHNGLDVDKVHDLLEDIAEQQEVAKEIAEVISSRPAGVDVYDDEELLKELDEMQVEDLNKELLKVPSSMEPLPSVDSGSNTTRKKSTEEELDELRAFAD